MRIANKVGLVAFEPYAKQFARIQALNFPRTVAIQAAIGDGTEGTLEITAPTGLVIGASDPLGALLAIDADQSLNVTNTTTIQSGARITALGGFASDRLTIESGGQFDAPSGYTNHDEIELSGTDARITGSVLINDGFISGQGRINLPLTNNGQVNVSGGTLRFGSLVTNNTGAFISSQGTSILRFDAGLENHGSLLASFSDSTVFGNLVNHATGLVSLAGNSTASFVGDVVNDGQLYVDSFSPGRSPLRRGCAAGKFGRGGNRTTGDHRQHTARST